jgi:hypothetical protein
MMNCRITRVLSGLGIAMMAVCLALIFFTETRSDPPLPPNAISGMVSDSNGPVAGATVRVRATDIKTTTDENGRFVILGLKPDEPIVLTAWAQGYYIGGGKKQWR